MERVKPSFVTFIPQQLDEGVLYISTKYRTAAHLCCCGCRTKIVTPLKPGFWSMTQKGGAVTLAPSVGNWNHPCQSHYLIIANGVRWAGGMSRSAIQRGRWRDRIWRQHNYANGDAPNALPHQSAPQAPAQEPVPVPPPTTTLQRLWAQLKSLFD